SRCSVSAVNLPKHVDSIINKRLSKSSATLWNSPSRSKSPLRLPQRRGHSPAPAQRWAPPMPGSPMPRCPRREEKPFAVCGRRLEPAGGSLRLCGLGGEGRGGGGGMAGWWQPYGAPGRGWEPGSLPQGSSSGPLSPCHNHRLPHRCWERRKAAAASPDVTPRRRTEPSPQKKKEKKEKDRENAKERSALSRERSLKKRQSLPAA
ncbi:MA7D1 protein, partial [Pomatorhinus ruficollis]|nr:MA7D1 protein [Pomatorhinus ruficollis]